MKLLLRYFRLAPSSMPATHGNDNDVRRRRIAAVRRLLAEIAVDSPGDDRCPDQDDAPTGACHSHA